MNLLHLESSGSWGGQEYRTCLEINWLNTHGHRAWLMCDPGSEVFAKAKELDTPVIAMSLQHRINPLASLRIWRFCRRHQIDLIKTYSSKDHWLCLPLFLCGMPVTRARCISDPLGKKKRAFIYKYGCAKIVADAQVIKKEFIEQHGISPEKIEVIGSAVDLTKFSPARDPMKFRREVGLPASTPLIANIGMIRPDKGQLIFVEAARLVLGERPDTRFVIVGQGTGQLKLGEKVTNAIYRANLDDRIIRTGYRWDTPDIFAASNIVVIASLRTEASSIVLREAFASGRAVVATKVGDNPEIIEDGENGLLVEPGDAQALAKAVVKFLSDPILTARCAANALRYAREHFCFNRMMEAKLDVDLALARGSKVPEFSSNGATPPSLAPVRRAELVSSD